MKILTKIINNIINVSITDETSDIKSDFDCFSETWRQFYLDKKYFIFKIDTTYLSKPDIKLTCIE